jgi:hypothetical protein
MKAIVKVNYKDFVMDAEKALTMLSLLEEAEVYESKWDGKTSAHYIYNQDSDSVRELRIIPDVLYRMAKLAGKPNKE